MFELCLRTGSRPRFEVFLLLLAVGTPLAFIWSQQLEFGLPFVSRQKFKETGLIHVSKLAPLQPQLESDFLLSKIAGQPPQTRVYDFFIDLARGAPDGVPRTMLVVNGRYPGPTIVANQWDRLVVNVHNNLPNATSIHWHGLFQNGTNYYDGTAGITQCGIPPGESLTYKYIKVSPSVIFMDRLGGNSTQYSDGITGALIVNPTESPLDFPTWDEELVIQLSDWYHDMSEALLLDYFSPEGITGYQGTEPVPDSGVSRFDIRHNSVITQPNRQLMGLVNIGQQDLLARILMCAKFTLQPNKAYRLRLVNTGSFANIRFSIDWHPLLLIEADGTLIKPVLAEAINIAVAQRYSAVIYTNSTHAQNKTFWMRAQIESDMFRYDQVGQNRDIRGILRYELADGLPGDPHSPNPGPGVSNILDANGFTHFQPFIPDPLQTQHGSIT
ncbi:hypothetical protein Clacol_003920 [Clathrus columnatus]|uniref:Multicopper oxidase n=1 Tax=Clathrus columnatus TaxID=1419009 RepID=A0AAV5AB42_9AGAM|nr:hypothetical protein Clacol_003920 [Clathrus columnatus]